jgi:hypothetical protein
MNCAFCTARGHKPWPSCAQHCNQKETDMAKVIRRKRKKDPIKILGRFENCLIISVKGTLKLIPIGGNA